LFDLPQDKESFDQIQRSKLASVNKVLNANEFELQLHHQAIPPLPNNQPSSSVKGPSLLADLCTKSPANPLILTVQQVAGDSTLKLKSSESLTFTDQSLKPNPFMNSPSDKSSIWDSPLDQSLEAPLSRLSNGNKTKEINLNNND
jgi:hypothetical protein